MPPASALASPRLRMHLLQAGMQAGIAFEARLPRQSADSGTVADGGKALPDQLQLPFCLLRFTPQGHCVHLVLGLQSLLRLLSQLGWLAALV